MWPDRQAVRHAADGDRLDRAVGGVDRIDRGVVARREPQRGAVGAHIAHVGAAAVGDRPVGDDFAALEVDHRNAAGALADAGKIVRAAVGHIEALSVAARIEAVSADAGRDEADFLESVAADHHDAVADHVGDEEHRAVRRDPDVLRHVAGGELQRGDQLALVHVDLDERVVEFASEDRIGDGVWWGGFLLLR